MKLNERSLKQSQFTFLSDVFGLLLFRPQFFKSWDNAIHCINHYPADSEIGFPNTYPLDNDLSGGYCYPTFEQLEPGVLLPWQRAQRLLSIEVV